MLHCQHPQGSGVLCHRADNMAEIRTQRYTGYAGKQLVEYCNVEYLLCMYVCVWGGTRGQPRLSLLRCHPTSLIIIILNITTNLFA